jgi:hypothetical protein
MNLALPFFRSANVGNPLCSKHMEILTGILTGP